MAKTRFVSYLRVSTARQGTSGLGLEAQRAAVAGFLNGGDWTLVEEVLEVESGKRNDRPALATALKLCRKHRATGAVSAPPGEITALSGLWDGDITRRETSSLGVNTVYWVWFDEPQFDADGDGPYRAGSIWESALTRID